MPVTPDEDRSGGHEPLDDAARCRLRSTEESLAGESSVASAGEDDGGPLSLALEGVLSVGDEDVEPEEGEVGYDEPLDHAMGRGLVERRPQAHRRS
jgi:hypothetical protein